MSSIFRKRGAPAPGDALEALRDLDGEIEHHLELLEEELAAGGMPHAAARSAALERFGDVSEIRYQTLAAVSPGGWIGSGPRRRPLAGMLLGAAAAVSLCLGLWGVIAQQRAESDRLDSLVSSVAAIRGGALAPLAQNVGFVTVEGSVPRPSLWVVPSGGHVTLREIIGRCGGLPEGESGTVTLTRLHGQEVLAVQVFSFEDLRNPDAVDPLLEGFYHIQVETGSGGLTRLTSSRHAGRD